jgi:hypothetical protein
MSDPAPLWAGLRRLVSGHHGAFAFLVYLAIAALWDHAAIERMGSVCPCGLPGDPAQYTWSFVWFPHALFHGLSLLHTKAMWAPTGINLAGGTATPLLAFLLAPITYIWGPIVSYNVITILAPVTAASSAYVLCRYVSKSQWAALIAGAAFGFSTYEIGQLNGHLHLVVIFCPPLAVWCVLRFLDAVISRRRFCVELAVILIAQFLISLEVFFTMSVLGVVALAIGWVLGEPRVRARIVEAVIPIVVAYVALAALLSWYLVAQLHASAYSTGTGAMFPTDALSLFTPMIYTWIGGHAFNLVTQMYVAGPGETDAYVGLPMVLIVVTYLARRWDQRATRWLAAMLVVTLFWVLGPRLYVAGKPTIWLPYALFQHLPGFDQVLQGRVAVYLALMCSVVLALWLSKVNRHRWLQWAIGLLAVAMVLPNVISPGSSNAATWENPKFFSTDMYKRYLHRGETILPIRWGWLSESPMWQAETHMYFNLASGYFTTSIPAGWGSPLTDDLWSDTPKPADAQLLRPLLIERHVSDIVVQPTELKAWGPILRGAGLSVSARVGGVVLYHVPASWSAKRAA